MPNSKYIATVHDKNGQTYKYMDEEAREELKNKAAAIFQNETTYTHILAESLTLIGNQYAWGNARYADRKNYIENIERDGTASGVTIESHGNIAIMNGTCTASNDITVLVAENANIPAGTYKYKLEIYAGTSVISGTKNFYIDFWYDGNETTTQSVRDSFGVGISDVTRTITLTSHVWKMRVWVDMKQGNVYNDFRVFYSLFPSDVTIVDTGETISSSETLSVTPSPAIKISDTMMHKSTAYAVVDTKKYVDSHTPDMVCFRPEDYGAKGDGATDDSVALQACITAAQANDPYYRAHCVRGYGTYKISTGIVFNCRELDVYINKIIYTGNDAAVTISASFSNFEFNVIDASTGGNSNIGIKCYQSAQSGWTNIFYNNIVKCNILRSGGNTVEFAMDNSLTSTVFYYNKFYFENQRSINANIIYAANVLGEVDFYGKVVSAPNGYLFYSATKEHGVVRLFNYSLESELKNGSNCAVKYYYCRTTEMENLQTPEDRTSGHIFVWENCVPAGEFFCGTGGVDLISFDVSNAYSWEDALDAVVATYEQGGYQHNESPWKMNLPSASTTFRCAEIDKICRAANANMASGIMRYLPEGKAYVYYKNIAYKPYHDVYCKIDADMTIYFGEDNEWNYVVPTTFDIDASSVTIRLDASYCCIATNEFKVIQHTGKTAIVIDKNGNTIFDGTDLGAGVYKFKCEFVPYKYHELYVTLSNNTIKYCPSSIVGTIYSGYNEKWTVTKETLIEPPAQS